jgi:hypothetical protein
MPVYSLEINKWVFFICLKSCPIAAVILVLTLKGTQYQEQRFQGKQSIISFTFSNLSLMAEQVLKAGKSK